MLSARRSLFSLTLLAMACAGPLAAQTVPTDAGQMRLSLSRHRQDGGAGGGQRLQPPRGAPGGRSLLPDVRRGMGLSRERIAQSLGSGVIVAARTG